jgi:hypothetical protein
MKIHLALALKIVLTEETSPNNHKRSNWRTPPGNHKRSNI